MPTWWGRCRSPRGDTGSPNRLRLTNLRHSQYCAGLIWIRRLACRCALISPCTTQTGGWRPSQKSKTASARPASGLPRPVGTYSVTPDRLYVWKDAGDEPIEVPPTYEEDITRTFAHYFNSAGLAATQISGAAFELVVAAWLADLTRKTNPAHRVNQEWLEQSGFRTAVQDGRVELDAER